MFIITQIFLGLILFQIMIILSQAYKIWNEADNNGAAACISERHIQRLGLNEAIFSACRSDYGQQSITNRSKRAVERIFKGKPKPRGELLATKFHMDLYNFEQTNSLVALVNKIAIEYLAKCPPTIYYDKKVQKSDGKILEYMFRTLPITFYHGSINEHYEPRNANLTQHIDNNCKSYILFLSDPLMTRKIIGPQTESRVVVISRSSQWKLRDFLSSEKSSNIVNLLVIGESLMADPLRERPYVLYTHRLYVDGLGSNTPVVLTSWIKGALSRPHINLFPAKLETGFAGHRFQVGAVNQPPFVFRMRKLDSAGTSTVIWDGVEYRLLDVISKKLNFSVDLVEPQRRADTRGIPEALQKQILQKTIDLGMSGIYITEERMLLADMSVGHSKDCAAFITLASKALPKYRAIMGPFQWPVWVALTLIYLGGVFPIVFTDRLTLRHLMGNWGEIENMFWYVFGMFTNAFTFTGQYSWSNSQKTSTRLLIGAYWLFTIIITACYTGSIIAFVTLPAFPDTVDSVLDLLGLFFRVGTLDNGGWETWFHNSTHEHTAKLFQKMEYVSSLEEGIGNVTQSFFWNYAFLGSKAQLEYLVQANFSDENISRRSALHLSEECFAMFQIGYLYPKNSVYKRKIDSMILLAQQSGIMNKISNEVSWVMQRSSTGRLLQASSSNSLRELIQEERQLTTADTEGMFLLMGVGYLMGAIAFISEIVGGITNKCRQIIKRSRKSFSSAFSSKRPSVDLVTKPRTKAEQKAHEKRRNDRRKIAEAEERNSHGGWGMREFNLTKTTLKELYGNYTKPQPNFVVQHGKLLVEQETLSAASTDCESRKSSDPAPHIKRRTKALVVAQVDFNVDDDDDDDDGSSVLSDQENINATLDILEGYLAPHICDNISEENIEDVLLQAGDDDGDDGKMHSVEDRLFGSFVGALEEEPKQIDNLKLFDAEKDLEDVGKQLSEKVTIKVSVSGDAVNESVKGVEENK